MTAVDTHKDKFFSLHGYWNNDLPTSLEADPEFCRDYLELADVAYNTSGLGPKTREFPLDAASASVTHLGSDAVAGHIDEQIRYGATKQELF